MKWVNKEEKDRKVAFLIYVAYIDPKNDYRGNNEHNIKALNITDTLRIGISI